MAKNKEDQTAEAEQPAAQEDPDKQAAKRAAKEFDESLKFETDDTGTVHATVEAPIPVNPSSTYPGRNQELVENDMRIPTELDLARRAKFAKSQIPARVHAAGLVDENGEITV